MKKNYFGNIFVLLSFALIVLSAIGITIFAQEPEPEAQNYTAGPVTVITTTEDFQNFVASVNTGGITYQNQEVILQSDIVWDGKWEPINLFDGTFNGEGHTISGLTDTFIIKLGESGLVKNLNVRSNILFSKGNIGGIVGVNEGIISGCTFGGVINSEEGQNENGCGGITGINFGRIENCSTTSDTNILRKGMLVGGIAGVCIIELSDINKQPSVGIYNCINNATITADKSVLLNYAGAMGGVCGFLKCPEVNSVLNTLGSSIQDCINNGNLTASAACTGGIVGIAENGKITGCENNGNITQSGSLWTGGIVGSFNQNIYNNHENTDIIYIKNCINRGNITGITRVGGIVGGDETNHKTSYMTIEDCINAGDITTNGYGGGISGYNASKMKRCYNTGNVYGNLMGQELTAVDGWNAVGGITAVNSNEISYCFNIGEVKLDVDEPLKYTGIAGGLVGKQEGAGKLIYCYNSGPVTGNHDSSTSETKSTVYYGGLVGQGVISAIENSTFNKNSAGKAERAVASYIGEDSDFGLEASKMTGEAAKVNMPYLFQDGVFEVMEDVTIDGVHYSFTPVLSDMENPYSINHDKMISNASYSYISITLPQGEGYLMTAAESYDPNHIEIGGNFGFYITLDEAYKNHELTVTANGEIITPNSEGIYYLTNLQTAPNLEVSLKAPEVIPNTFTQNENSDGNTNENSTKNTDKNSNTDNPDNTIEQLDSEKTGDITIMGIILLALISVVVIVFVVKKKKN